MSKTKRVNSSPAARKPKAIPAKWRKIFAKIPGYDPIATAALTEWFDAERADLVVGFVESCCRHVKGEKATTPLILEDWQKAIFGCLFGWKRANGKRRYRECLVYIPRKNSKALALDTPLPCPGGWTTMGSVAVGDELFDDNGLPCTVTNVSPIYENHDCYSVKFSDGTAIVADAGHLWKTHTRKPEDKIAVRTTELIRDTLFYGNRPNVIERNHSIGNHGPLVTDAKALPIPPYALGMWLGDGHSGGARFTFGNIDSSIVGNVERCGVSVSRIVPDTKSNSCRASLGVVGRNNKGSLHVKLKKLGLINNKHIPSVYLRASYTQRLELLQGLMDTDGSITKRGQCDFTNCNFILAKQVAELVRSLGMKTHIRKYSTSCNGKQCGPCYKIQYCAYSDTPVFQLQRKLSRQRIRPEGNNRSTTRQIISVDRVESVPVRCVQVDSPSHMYLAGEGMVPTHNSTMGAAMACVAAFTDHEPGVEIYSTAAEIDQAAICWSITTGMMKQEPEMMSRVDIQARQVIIGDDGIYKALTAKPETKHGFNPHFVLNDELHAHKNSELTDAMETGMGARSQPLIVHMTTADYERPESVCNQKHDYACKVRDGVIKDSAFLPIIYETSKDADWTDPAVWALANPNLGVGIDPEYFERQFLKAKETPSFQNEFKRLHLNIRTEQLNRWLLMDKWNDCGNEKFTAEDFTGMTGYGAIDLSSKLDLTCWLMLFPRYGGYYLVPRFFIPRDNAHKRERDDRVPYTTWADQGYVTLTDGDTIDYDTVLGAIMRDLECYNIRKVAYDPWMAEPSAQKIVNLSYGSVEMVKFIQGIKSFTMPSKELEKLVIGGKLYHGNNPVMRWCASNVSVYQDTSGNIRPVKPTGAERIDGIVTAIMALGMALLEDDGGGDSIYRTRGALMA